MAAKISALKTKRCSICHCHYFLLVPKLGRRMMILLLLLLLLLQLNCYDVVASSSSSSSSLSSSSSSSEESQKSIQQKPSSLSSFLSTIRRSRKHLVAAAIARSISISGMYPVDTIKTRIQLDKLNPFRLSGLYGGLGGSLIGQMPYGVLTFGSYEMYKFHLLQQFPNFQQHPTIIYAISAIFGDITGSIWLNPSELIKQQMQAGMYPTTSQAFKSIIQKHGIRKGLYQGYLSCLARDVPFRVAQLTSYEVTKNMYLNVKKAKANNNRQRRRHHHRDRNCRRRRHLRLFQQQQSVVGRRGGGSGGDNKLVELELSPLESAICGALAGTFSAAVTCPLDRIKTMLMTNNGDVYGGGSVIGCARKIMSQEGIAGFTTGMLPRVLYIAPSVAIFFIAYETIQQRLKHWY